MIYAAQGDILIERLNPSSEQYKSVSLDASELVIAEGELTGHCHKLMGDFSFFRDDSLARDLPRDLYIGHAVVNDAATLLHDEHGPIALASGLYRFRRQRQLDPWNVNIVDD
jgi:hypothetical protein